MEPTTKAWTADPHQIPVPAGQPGGRPRKFVPRAALPEPQTLAERARSLPPSAWQRVTWRTGTKGPQRSRCAKVKVWAAHGWKAQRHPGRVAEWRLVEWAQGAPAPRACWLADLGPPPVGLRRRGRLARSRGRVELDCRELKEELGWDHYEGRHWLGWPHHVTRGSLAFAFLRQEQVRPEKKLLVRRSRKPAGLCRRR